MAPGPVEGSRSSARSIDVGGPGAAKNWEQLSEFERRSCATKKRYKVEPHCRFDERAYPCNICGGWHKASRFKIRNNWKS